MHRLSHLALGLLLPLTLAACSTAGTPSAPAFYGDGLDHRWTASAEEGQQLLASFTGGLQTQGVNLGLSLSVTAENNWGPIEVNQSNGETLAGDGHTLTLNGVTYPTGLGVHAYSDIHIHATGLETPACTRFRADIGIDDEVGDKGSATFQVYADGVRIFDSGVMTGASATQHLDLPVGGKHDLRFVVDPGSSIDYDHADWAGARLECGPAQTAPTVTLDKSNLDIYHLHTGTLKATFNHYPKGPVQLALVFNPDGPVDPNNPTLHPDPYPLTLQTTQVELSGLPSETRDLVIAAPEPGTYINSPNFFLTVTAAGTGLQRLPVTLTERPINFAARFEPAAVSGRDGETATTMLVVTADPPLDSPQSLDITYASLPPDLTDSSSLFQITTVGPLTGTGAEMRRAVTVKFNQGNYPSAELPYVSDPSIGVQVGAITTGYRDPFYGSGPRASITLTLNP